MYTRKSSESEDRQIQSIDDQINQLKKLAQAQGLCIIDTYQESKSAKKPDNRPLFSEMVKRIERGEANGILCWQINRLSRNPKDSGDIQWLLQTNKIESIMTFERQYLPNDNALLFNIESGVANQFILDLSKNVKRGIQSKLEKGWRPGSAPLGYLNERLDHTIIIDKARFPLIRKAWDLMLTGNFTVPQVLNKLNNEWGFRTLKKRRGGNCPMAMSGLYAVFTNLFYTGLIPHKGKLFPGKHKPMISMEEYDRVQKILGRDGKPRPRTRQFTYTGLVRCGHCGCIVTAETKSKKIKSTGEIREYTYYHCTWQKRDVECHQQSITDINLEGQVLENLKNMAILPEFKEFALEIIRTSNDKEIEQKNAVFNGLVQKQISLNNQLDNLTRMRYREQIDDAGFEKERKQLQDEILRVRDELGRIDGRVNSWIDLTEKAFVFATRAREAFLNGNYEVRRMILRTIGFEFTLLDKKLEYKPFPWFEIINTEVEKNNALFSTLEPDKNGLDKRKTASFETALPRWHGVLESNQC